MNKFIRPTLALATLLGVSCGGAAFAATPPPSTGLGQSWPNAPDASSSPQYHVYVFERGGLRFVQVNDVNGTVRGAVVYADGDVVSLPVGVDANRWATPTEGVSNPASGAAEDQVYDDGAMSVTAAPQSDGTTRLRALVKCGNPAECSVKGP